MLQELYSMKWPDAVKQVPSVTKKLYLHGKTIIKYQTHPFSSKPKLNNT